MTQKRIGDILYVFQVTPYQITQDTDAEVIKVQEECYNGFVELNPDLAEKIVRYNYHTMTVTQQEWAPYVDEPQTQTITVTAPHGLNILVESDGSWVQMTPDPSDPDIDTGTLNIGASYSVEQRDGIGQGKTVTFTPQCGTGPGTVGEGFTAPNEDLTITLSEPASGYTVTLDGESIHAHVTVKMNNETVSTEFQYLNVADNTVIDIYPTEDASHYSLQSGATWDTDHWTATINGSDLTIEINYIG